MTYAGRRGDLIAAGGLFGLTLLLGGGSVVFPIQRMLVEFAAVVVLGWFFLRGWQAQRGLSANVGLGIVALTMVLILAQLMPLPPALWQALPGRALPADVLGVVGAADRWQPISLDTTATRATVFYFLVPAVLFGATLALDRQGHRLLLRIFVAFALLNALLVVLQAQGITALTLYWTTPTRPGVGLFANKNHCAAMLVAAMPAAVAVCRDLLRERSPITRGMASVAAVAFLAVTTFGCLSRAGLALMPLGIGAALLIGMRGRLSRRTLLIGAGIFVVLLLLAYLVLPRTYVVAETLERFNTDREGRYDFWPNVLSAIRDYFPVGSGLGTFVQVFTVHETLENVHQTYTNHAHSDYLEILLETGIAGMVLVIVFLVWFAATSWRRLRDTWRGAGFDTVLSLVTAVGVLLLHSSLDYPLRTITLAGVCAVAAAILASPLEFRGAISTPTGYGRRKGSRQRLR